MKRYCDQCGAEIKGDLTYCSSCGNKLNKQTSETSRNNTKIIIGLLVVIICILSAMIILSGALDFKNASELEIISASEIDDTSDFIVRLSDENGGIPDKNIKVRFSNGETYDYAAVTDKNGEATVNPSLNTGDYKVYCEFEGDSEYKEVSLSDKITITETEPDYESYWYSHSFSETDTNRDGYVMLSDMNIAHTPQDVQMQMFRDSDDDGDGKLNEHEYYKFMYKMNYDSQSYGL